MAKHTQTIRRQQHGGKMGPSLGTFMNSLETPGTLGRSKFIATAISLQLL